MRKNIFVIVLAVLFFAATAYPLTYEIKTQIVSVTTTATKLPSTALVGRKYVTIQNVGSAFVYIGDETVTADTASTGGYQLAPYASKTREYDHTVDIYGIVASGTADVVVEEGK